MSGGELTHEQVLSEWRQRHHDYWQLAGIPTVAEDYANVVVCQRLGLRSGLSFGYDVSGYGGTDKQNRRHIRSQVDRTLDELRHP